MKALNTPSRSFFAGRNKSALIAVVFLAMLTFQTAESKANKQTGNAIDVSRDLVPLHIAQSNLPANDQNVDAGPLLAAAVAYATKNGVNIVNIPMGNYYFASARNDAFLYIKGANNVDLVGHASNFIFSSRQHSGIMVFNSSNIGIENITLDYAPDLPFTAAVVSSVDVASRNINFKTVLGRPVSDLNNAGRNAVRVFVLRKNSGSDDYSRLPIERLEVVKGQLSNSNIQVKSSPYLSETMLDNDLAQIRPGDMLSISERSYTGNNALSFSAYPPAISSGNYAKNVTVYSSPALGVACLWQNSITMTGVKVITKPGRSQFLSSNADGINMTNTGSNSKVDNCTIVGSGDDGISITSNLLGFVTAVNPDNSYVIAVRYLLSLNQTITINDSDNLNESTAAVTSIQELPEKFGPLKQFRVTLNHPLPVSNNSYLFISKENRSPGLIVQNNLIRQVNARGIYVTGVSGVQILSNTIQQSNSSGICLQELIEKSTAGYKTPGNSDITIVGNKITDAFAWGFASAKGAIEASLEVEGRRTDASHVNNNIIIQNNQITLSPDRNAHHAGIFLSNSKKLHISNNTMQSKNNDGSTKKMSGERAIVTGEKVLGVTKD